MFLPVQRNDKMPRKDKTPNTLVVSGEIFVLLTVILIFLKLTGAITISWFLVFLPIVLPIIVCILILLAVILFGM